MADLRSSNLQLAIDQFENTVRRQRAGLLDLSIRERDARSSDWAPDLHHVITQLDRSVQRHQEEFADLEATWPETASEREHHEAWFRKGLLRASRRSNLRRRLDEVILATQKRFEIPSVSSLLPSSSSDGSGSSCDDERIKHRSSSCHGQGQIRRPRPRKSRFHSAMQPHMSLSSFRSPGDVVSMDEPLNVSLLAIADPHAPDYTRSGNRRSVFCYVEAPLQPTRVAPCYEVSPITRSTTTKTVVQALEPLVSCSWQFTFAQQAWDIQGHDHAPLQRRRNSGAGFLRRDRAKRALSSRSAQGIGRPRIRLCIRIGPEGELIPLSPDERILVALISFGDIAATGGWLMDGWPRLFVVHSSTEFAWHSPEDDLF